MASRINADFSKTTFDYGIQAAIDLGVPIGGFGEAFDDLGVFSAARIQMNAAASPDVSWHPIYGIGAPGLTYNGYWNGAVPPRLQTILNALGYVTTDIVDPLIFTAAESDFLVTRASAVDGNLDASGSPFPGSSFQSTAKTSHNHVNVGQRNSVADTMIELLDLEYDKPTSAGYTLGATFFNDGM